MALSLRARLTAWYSVLLVLTVALFSMAVLGLHWRLLLAQFDDNLASISATADNVVDEELTELRDLGRAAAEMAAVVRPPDFVVQVLDSRGMPLLDGVRPMPLPGDVAAPAFRPGPRTIAGADGHAWRMTARPGRAGNSHYFVAVGAPLEQAVEQWRTLLRACLIGIPLALLFAIAGGLWLGRHGLEPLTSMAAEAAVITAKTPDARLTVPPAGAELERLALSFNTVLERLADALATQRRFMADASHELRTPVSIMRTAADVTLSQPLREESEYREALAAVSQQTSRVTRLVDDMLVLARADGGGYPVVMADVDMAALIGDCVRELAGRAASRNIRMHSSIAPVTLQGDEALLRRMFVNLLTNALTYTPPGGCVDVSLAKRGDSAVVSIADTGPGIRLEDRQRVFERFVRLDPARGGGGAGLGLAIARWVAEAHGGGVRIVSSDPGRCVFAATLPA